MLPPGRIPCAVRWLDRPARHHDMSVEIDERTGIGEVTPIRVVDAGRVVFGWVHDGPSAQPLAKKGSGPVCASIFRAVPANEPDSFCNGSEQYGLT